MVAYSTVPGVWRFQNDRAWFRKDKAVGFYSRI